MFAIDNISAVIGVYGGALPAAFLMAITFALFGTFVVLKRMVFIGVTLSEVASCGVAFALIHELPPFVGAALFCLIVVAILSYPYELSRLPRDTMLGTIFIFASGMSILLVARSGFGLEKVKAILYGNLLFASTGDLAVIGAVMIPALIMLLIFFRPVLYSFLDRESAITLGINVWLYELMFFVFLGLIVAAASRIAGVMLVFCYLVVPAATALLLSGKLLRGMLLSCVFAVTTTILGIMTSYQADLPPNQLIAAVSCALFVIAIAFKQMQTRLSKTQSSLAAATMLAALIWFLSSLTISIEAAGSPPIKLPAHPAPTTPVSSVQTVVKEQSSLDWPAIVEEIEQTLARDQNEGQKKADAALKQNPPFFFKETITDLLRQQANQP